MRRIALAAFTSAALTVSASAAGHAITMTSKHDVKTTADKLVAAIEKAGATLFAVVDHQAGAKKAGLDMPPATLVIFGNPKIGTPIMKADVKAGLDLPMRVLIAQQDGVTTLHAVSPNELSARYSLKGAEMPLKKMGGALNKLLSAASQ